MIGETQKNVDPSAITGAKKLRYMEGYLTVMEERAPVRLMGKHEVNKENQMWEIEHVKDRNTFKILFKKDPKKGLHYSEHVYMNSPVMLGDRPCEFKIEQSHKGQGYYHICPIVRTPECDNCMVGMSSMLVYPPLVAMMPAAVEKFSWKFEDA